MNWINIEEKMPENNVPVLVFVTNSVDYEDITLGCFDEDTWFTESESFEDGDKVTHWMPLPEKPTGKK